VRQYVAGMTDRRRRAATLGLLLVLTAAVLGACGTSDDEPEATPTATTTTASADVDATEREAFIAEGDAICADGQLEAAELKRRAQEIEAQRGTLTDEELVERAAVVWDDQIALIERYQERFEDLDPPAGDEARVEEFIGTLDDGAERARDIKAALDDGEAPSPELLQTYFGVVARGNELARAFGFRVCGLVS
jgi:hypothetical protein